ncbi:hypothetical protein [Pontibacter sp. G13]|uniref:hypothetical protein n=1 Tax=Pontibacter sp. G13 TaxID=3074898 RepID=UPI00288916D3|nr:hypothetical protein [Pontibacter sp. G13]WNJ20919.1 hypothetical protein RJD25_10615 [Pontibacter sp. G13]
METPVKRTYQVHILAKLGILLSVPILCGWIFYLVFDVFQDSFSAEVWMEVTMPTAEFDPSGEVSAEPMLVLENRLVEVEEMLDSEPILWLLAYSLVEHDLSSEEPFRDMADIFTQYDFEDLTQIKHSLRDRLDHLQVNLGASAGDSLVLEILHRQGYTPETLRQRIRIYRISGTQQIRIVAEGVNPGLAAFLANGLGQLSVAYYQQIEQERVEANMEVLSKLLEQKRIELATKNLRVQQARKQLAESRDEQTVELFLEIQGLEQNRDELLEHLESLRVRLRNDPQFSSTEGIVIHRASWQLAQAPDREALLVELGRTLAQLEEVNQSLQEKKNQLMALQHHQLKPVEQDANRVEQEYIEAITRWKTIQMKSQQVQGSLRQIRMATARHFHPSTSIALSLMAFVGCFLLWLVCLLQWGFFRFKQPNT